MKLIGAILVWLASWAVLSLFLGPVIGAGGAFLLAGLLATSHLETPEEERQRQQQEQLDRVEQLLRQKD